jgi:NifU-like protein involved in Fe-S cluster formation
MILTPELERHMHESPDLLKEGDRWGYNLSKLAINRDCGDAVVLYLKTESFENIHYKIIDCRYRHEGCMLSRMSANIMMSRLRGLLLPQTCKVFADTVLFAIETGIWNGDPPVIRDLANMTLNRKKCIALPWIALKEMEFGRE